MDMNKVKSYRKHKRCIPISIRITADIRDWLTEKELSPTKIFYEAVKELGYNNETKPEETKEKETTKK